jgi:pyruvate dehydrogenase E2 component (dihydrolipoamide acetyltransferase)
MARVDVIMPQMGESIAEGTVSRWLKKVGDTVKRDEPILEISTDKVDAEIPSPASGVLAEIAVQEGSTVEVQTVIAVIETDAAAAAAAPPSEKAPPAAEPAAKPVEAAPAQAAPKAEPPAAPPPQPSSAPAAAKSDGGEETLDDRLRARSTPVGR